MSKLASLHSQLTTLKHTRATVRLVTAFAALATAILWALIGIFILDVWFELPLLPRRPSVSPTLTRWPTRTPTLPGCRWA